MNKPRDPGPDNTEVLANNGLDETVDGCDHEIGTRDGDTNSTAGEDKSSVGEPAGQAMEETIDPGSRSHQVDDGATIDHTSQLNAGTGQPTEDNDGIEATMDPGGQTQHDEHATMEHGTAILGADETGGDDFDLATQVTGSGGKSVIRDNTKAKQVSAVGKEVGGYKIVAELGRGGMGVVYKAEHLKLKRTAALKMVLAGAHASKDALDRFILEAQSVAHLQHPNIVQIFDIGDHENLPFFSLEYVDGSSLAETLEEKPLTAEESARIVVTLAEALQYAHDEGIVHRDIKPGNILLTKEGEPKIADFGLAKQLEDDTGTTRTGTIMGTPGYMPPEQAGGRVHDIGPASDQYSLGALLYRLMTGRPPFVAAKAMEAIMQVLRNDPVAPRQLSPEIPVDLETICLKTLQKDTSNRYASCQELADDLNRFLNGEPILARPVGKVEQAWRWCKRNPGVAIPSAVAVTLLLLATVVSTWSYFTVSGQAAKIKEDAEVIKYERDLAREQENIAKRNEQIALKNEQIALGQTNLVLTTLQDVLTNIDGTLSADPGLLELRVSLLEKLSQSWDKIDEAVRDDEKSEAIPTLMSMRMRLVGIYRNTGQGDQAETEIEKLYETGLRRIEVKEGSDAARRNMASICLTYGDILDTMQRDQPGSLARYEEALSYLVDILEKPKPPETNDGPAPYLIQHLMASSHQRIAKAHMLLGDLEAAETNFAKAVDVGTRLIEGLDTDERFAERDEDAQKSFRLEAGDSFARYTLGYATLLLKRGSTEQAIAEFEKVVQNRRENMDGNPANLRARLDFGEFAGNYGFICVKEQRLDRAQELLQEHLDIMGKFANDERFQKNAAIQDKYSLAVYRWATLLGETGQEQESQAAFEQSRDIRKTLAEKDATNKRAKTMLMLSLARCGDWELATALADELLEGENPTPKQHIDSARAWTQSARFNEERRDEFQDRALELLQTAVDQGYTDQYELDHEPDLQPIRELEQYTNITSTINQSEHGTK